MKTFALTAIAFACTQAFAQVPAQANKLNIEVAPGNKVTVVKDTNPATRNRTITVGPNDTVSIFTRVEMHGGLNVDTSTLPPRAIGYADFRVRPTTEQPSPSNSGAFRTSLAFSHFSFDDPIVYPGFPGKSHCHTFFGNTGTDAYSDEVSIRTTGNSTSRGGIANRSAYWVPCMLDVRTNKPLVPDSVTAYYKNGLWSTLEGYGWKGPDGVWHEVIDSGPDGRPKRKFPGFADLPLGLRMVIGNPNRTTPRTNKDPFDYRFTCQGPQQTFNTEIPVNCPVGSYVEQEILAPPCWDGVNTDSPDHKSHMAYPVSVFNRGDSRGWSHYECPSTHPVVIPSISINVNYNVRQAGEPAYWALSCDTNVTPGAKRAFCSHGDWFNGWDPAISSTWRKFCIEKMVDCHAHLLGDGREMF